MTPYELERARERLEDATKMALESNTMMTLLVANARALSTILNHLADVEADANIARRNADR